MECRFAEQRLQAYLDGELPRDERAELKSHLAVCASCSLDLQELREAARLLHAAYESVEEMLPGPDEFAGRVFEGIEAAKVAPPRSGQVDRVVAGYEIIGRIGTGAMGAVYKARQVSIDRPVALKILPQHLARDKEFTERFIREARACGRLTHENIVGAIDVGRIGNTYYFAMEYVDGRSVKEVLKERTRLSEREVLDIAIQIARALTHAWEAGIVHRDVKPDNIMVTPDGTAKLCDLGLARASGSDAGLTQNGMVVGTPHYIAPEQASGDPDIDTRADIYALGATIYAMLTGRVPFEGPTSAAIMARHVTEPFPEVRDRVPEVSSGMAAVVRKMTAKERKDRYADPRSLLADLQAVREGKEPAAARPAAPRPSSSSRLPRVAARRPRRPRNVWPAVMGGVGAVAAAALLLFLGRPPEEVPSGGKPEEGRSLAAGPGETAPPTPAPGPAVEEVATGEPSAPATAQDRRASPRREPPVNRPEEPAFEEVLEIGREALQEAKNSKRFDRGLQAIRGLKDGLPPGRTREELARLEGRLLAAAEQELESRVSAARTGRRAGSRERHAPPAEETFAGMPSEVVAEFKPRLERTPGEIARAEAERRKAGLLALAELSRKVGERASRGDVEGAREFIDRARGRSTDEVFIEGLRREENFLRDLEAARQALAGGLRNLLESGAEVTFRLRAGRGQAIRGRVEEVSPEGTRVWILSTAPGPGMGARSRVEVERFDPEGLLPLIRKALSGDLPDDPTKAERAAGAFLAAMGDPGAAERLYRKALAGGLQAAGLRGGLERLLEARKFALSGLLHGKIEALPEGRIALSYDFAGPEQFKDWVAHEWPAKSAKGQAIGPPAGRPWALAEKALAIAGPGGVKNKARFTGELTVTFECDFSPKEGIAGLIAVRDEAPGSFYAAVVGFDGRVFLEKWVSGLPRTIGETVRLSPRRRKAGVSRPGTPEPRRVKVILRRSFAGLSCELDEKGPREPGEKETPTLRCSGRDIEYRSGAVAIWALGGRRMLKSVRIEGTVDPAWLEQAAQERNARDENPAPEGLAAAGRASQRERTMRR